MPEMTKLTSMAPMAMEPMEMLVLQEDATAPIAKMEPAHLGGMGPVQSGSLQPIQGGRMAGHTPLSVDAAALKRASTGGGRGAEEGCGLRHT